MNDTYELRMGEAHIEVHKFRGGSIAAAAIVALFLQTAVPVHFPKFAILDRPSDFRWDIICRAPWRSSTDTYAIDDSRPSGTPMAPSGTPDARS